MSRNRNLVTIHIFYFNFIYVKLYKTDLTKANFYILFLYIMCILIYFLLYDIIPTIKHLKKWKTDLK